MWALNDKSPALWAEWDCGVSEHDKTKSKHCSEAKAEAKNTEVKVDAEKYEWFSKELLEALELETFSPQAFEYVHLQPQDATAVPTPSVFWTSASLEEAFASTADARLGHLSNWTSNTHCVHQDVFKVATNWDNANPFVVLVPASENSEKEPVSICAARLDAGLSNNGVVSTMPSFLDSCGATDSVGVVSTVIAPQRIVESDAQFKHLDFFFNAQMNQVLHVAPTAVENRFAGVDAAVTTSTNFLLQRQLTWGDSADSCTSTAVPQENFT